MGSWIVHRTDRPKPYTARYQAKGNRAISKSFANKRQAEQWLKVQAVDNLRGEWADPRAGQTLFKLQAERWMASRRNRPTTAARDESLMRSLVLPAFGDKPLRAITTEAIEEWISATSVDHASATVRKAYQLLSGVLTSAVRARRLTRSPAEGVALPRMERTERRFLTVDEIHDLADAIDPRYRLLVMLGAYCGLRLGEMAALRVSSFGVGYRTLTVTETLTDVKGIIRIGPPKTRASVRVVTLPRFLAAEIKEYLSNTLDPGQLVFPAPEGGPLRFSAFRQRVWRPAVERAGIEWCTPHALRHSQVALLIEAGEQPLTIAKRLGHTSVRVILDTYGHLFEGMDEAAAEKLDEKSRTRRAPNQVADIATVRKTTRYKGFPGGR